ncbi:MAG TPA: apolipoprotein N-acyltransferase [Nocardioides sp.]|nr:apolipoprotein N-acyltransferase [Nocardioides sp.]
MTARLLTAALCGAMLAAAYEPIAVPYVLPFAVAGMVWSLRSLSVRRAGLVGWVFGLCFFVVHIDWLARGAGVGAWLGLTLAVSLTYALVGAATPLVRALPYWPLWLATLWTGMEDLRSTWPFGGMPWGRLAYAAIDTPVAPAVAYVGMSALSLALALLGCLLAAAIDERSARWGGAALGTLALLCLPALVPVSFHQDGTTTVAAVQGDVPGGDNMLADPRGITRNENSGTRRLADDVAAGRRPKPAFVLWPENSSVVDVFYDAMVNQLITQAVASVGVPVVVGAVVQQGEHEMLNQGIVWDPETGPGDRFTKHHPVPFGEYIPLRGLLGDPRFGRLAMVPRDMVGGTRSTPLSVGGVRLGDAICFDVAYDEVLRDQVRNGADLLAVQTSNATFIYTGQVDQQFAITRLRAIEEGRWLVVASTNGLSGVIGPDGRVVETLPRRTSGILEATVGLSTALTPAVRWGAWPSRGIGVLALVALAWGAVTYRRERGKTSSQGGRGALRRVHRDAADRALRDHQGRELDRDPADDRAAGARQPAGDVADPA